MVFSFYRKIGCGNPVLYCSLKFVQFNFQISVCRSILSQIQSLHRFRWRILLFYEILPYFLRFIKFLPIFQGKELHLCLQNPPEKCKKHRIGEQISKSYDGGSPEGVFRLQYHG